jgi:hypothetical protein
MTLACWDDPAVLITSLKHNEHLYHVDFDSDVNIDVSRAWLLAGSPTAALPLKCVECAMQDFFRFIVRQLTLLQIC